ncbi:hypothetical protein ACROYT_G041378 [Oculina patagonica]
MGASHSRLWAISLPLSMPVLAFAYYWWKQRQINYEQVGYVSGLFIYPVKSCAGISLETANCLTAGIQFDRHWVVVDQDDKFITSVEKPVLSQVKPHFEDEMLCLNAPDMDTLRVPIHQNNQEYRVLRVLRISSRSQYAGDEAAVWFSTLLDKPGCKLYQIHELRDSTQDTKWGNLASPGDKCGYASFCAYHMTTESSLVELNKILPSPVGMDRFRANVVIGGTKPYAEDQWAQPRKLKIADVTFRSLKDCGRCAQTTIDPETGIKNGIEPVKTLRRSGRLPPDRDPRHGSAPFFGIQLAPDCEGVIKLGDPVFIST